MELKMTVSCEEVVKPSSLTPHHLRFYPFSFLDEFAPPYLMPFVFFYENKINLTDRERADELKRALSETLSLFYPLAGRIKKNNTGIECNDEGVRFVEAKVDCKMSHVLENRNRNPGDLNRFLSFEHQEASDVPLTVKLTFFDCGGLALGVNLSHKTCDAFSGLMFIRSWAANACGDIDDMVTPCFDLAKLFPPCEIGNLNIDSEIVKEKIVTRRFVFSKTSLESLRERFSGSEGFRATRVEALSGFIWSRFMASKADDGNRKMYTVIHPVNLRRYANPIIPENMFGNIMRLSVTTFHRITSINGDEERHSLVQQIREGIQKINAEHVKELQKDTRGHLEILMKQVSGFFDRDIVPLMLTSLCRFPLYDADFGWGKPSWVSSATMGYKNLVAFIDTKKGDGIEVWINMEEKDISKFEADEELLSYVS